MKVKWLFVWIVIVVFTLTVAMISQTDEIPTRVTDQNRTGDLPFSATVGTDIESVDIATGALHVRIPILQVKGRGLDYDFHLYYDSNFFVLASRLDQFGDTYHQWTLDRNSGRIATGWGENRPYWSATTGTFPCQAQTETYIGHLIYHDESNGKHAFASQKHLSGPCPMNDLSGPDQAAHGMLGKAGISQVTGSGYDANGTQVGPSAEDSNGNKMTWASAGVDSLGRTLVTLQTVGNQGTYSVKDSSGTVQNYLVNFNRTYQAKTSFPDEAGGGSGVLKQYNSTSTVISSVVLPNGRSYVFTYDQPAPYAYGNIVEIDLPTGAVVTYAWNTFENDDFSYSRKVTDRTVTVGGQQYHWHFAYTLNSVTVTDPANNQSVYTVIAGAISNAAFYKGTAAGNPIRNHKMDYVTDTADPMVDPYGAPPDPQTTQYLPGNRLIRITTTLDDGRVSKKEFDYETFNYTFHPRHTGLHYTEVVTFTTSRGNVAEIREYDYGTVPGTYGQGTPGAILRRTDKTYLHNSNSNYLTYNIVNKVLQNTVFDGGGTQKAQTQYEYDTTALVSSGGAPQHDATYTTSFTFRGNVSKVKRWRNTDSALLATTYTYDDLGNIVSVSDPLTHTSTYDYADSWSGTSCPPPSNSHAYVTTFTNPANQQTKMTRYPCTGLLQARKDPNDIAAARAGTTYLYDLLGRTTQKSLPDGGLVSGSYNDVPPVTLTSTTKITGSLNLVSVATLDGLGRVVNTQITSDPDGTTSVDTTYDAFGRKSTVSNPHRSAPLPTDGTTTYSYDPLSRVTTVAQPDNSQVLTSYVGNTVTVTDEAGKKRTSQTDALGRLTTVWEDPSGLNYETDYQYDALDNLLRVDQKGGDPNSADWRTRLFTYNSLSQLLTASNPESGSFSYAYDNDGNVQTKTAPLPNQTGASTVITTYSYDVLNRLTQKSYNDGSTPTVKFGYDAVALAGCTTGPPAMTDGNPAGYRTAMCDGSGAVSWSHDAMGRPLQEGRTIGTVAGKFTAYVYNLDGSLASLTNPISGTTVAYTYSGARRALNATTSSLSLNYATAATYAPTGALATMINGNATGFAGITITNSYNKRLQPAVLSAASPSQTILSLSYDFHLASGDNGNVYQIVNGRDNNRTQNFIYDGFNRISQASTTGPNWGETFTIDPWGNLTNRGPVSGKTNYELLNAAPASPQNRLPGFGYDAAGNMTSNGPAGYSYDAENRLLSTAGVTYTYDGDGKRVKKSTGPLYWTGTGNDPLNESDLAGTFQKEYVFFNGKRVARRDADNSVHYYFSDHLSSASVITNATGAMPPQEESDYYPYGGEIVVTNSDPNPYKFTGKERDAESGLDMFGARYYGSSLGRFMTPDWSSTPSPVPFASPTDPQTLNLYAYEKNNPLAKPDLDGHSDVGTFQNQCMHSDSCRAAQLQYVQNHPVASTLTPVVAIGASVTTGMFGAELGAAALVRFAPLLTAAGSALQTARDEATSAIQSLKSLDLSNATSSRVNGALNSLSDHVTDMDIKGAVREANGALEGNHATGELKDAVNSLSNLKDSLQGALQNPNLPNNARVGFAQAVQAINNFVQSARPLIDQARKQQEAQ
jgi:RHS repeat-associated protein